MRALVVVALATACKPIDPPPIIVTDPGLDTPDGRVEVLTIKAVPNSDLDLLFVIDDSPSMTDKQNALKSAFPAFAAQLQALPGGLPNLHLGIVSSDLGTKGSAVAAPGPAVGQVGNGGCSGNGKAGALQVRSTQMNPGATFIEERRDGFKNFTGTLADVFGQNASLGAGGCGFEQQLGGMRAALANPMNAGFLRDSANLAAIVLTDEDDCSLRDPALLGPETPALGPIQSFRCFKFGVECAPDDPDGVGPKLGCKPRPAAQLIDDVAPFAQALLDAKHGDARTVMFGAIAGDLAPVAVELRTPPGGTVAVNALAHTCSYDVGTSINAVADPPVRLQALVDSFPGRAKLTSVCSVDLTPAAVAMGKTVRRLVGDPCLEKPIRTPQNCIVVDVRDSSPGIVVDIPPCSEGGSGDCFDLVADTTCTDGAPLRLAVTRRTPPLDDTWTTVRCVVP